MSALHGIPRASSNGVGDGSVMTLNTSGESHVGEVIRAALVLVDNELAIHGTNNPGSVGGLVSAGCIRKHNKDIMDLYGRVHVGTRMMFSK
jgi:lipoprotein-anchoring transpeptidase ErfK/SrfK